MAGFLKRTIVVLFLGALTLNSTLITRTSFAESKTLSVSATVPLSPLWESEIKKNTIISITETTENNGLDSSDYSLSSNTSKFVLDPFMSGLENWSLAGRTSKPSKVFLVKVLSRGPNKMILSNQKIRLTAPSSNGESIDEEKISDKNGLVVFTVKTDAPISQIGVWNVTYERDLELR